MLSAIVRTYSKHGEAVERWKCPKCGATQEADSKELFNAIDSGIDYYEDCYNCGQSIKLNYRRMFRKNY